jgi:hypothetical protein
MITDNPKFVKLLIIIVFAIGLPVIIVGINMYDENIINPRIWEEWTCDEMERFALEDRDDTLNDYQASKFHDDLSECLSR